MSWFEIVSVAKSTLKVAQKTIDKALDITEEESDDKSTTTSAPPCKEEADSFFSAWGVKSDGSPSRAVASPSSQDNTSASLWGSFTGSFFENAKPMTSSSGDESLASPVSEQPKRSVSSRLLGAEGDLEADSDLALGDDRAAWEGFTRTQLVVESVASTSASSKEDKTGLPAQSEEIKWRHKDRRNERSQNRNSYPGSRLSVISSESDKRSDSVEVLGSNSCTTSPDSDLPISISASSLASSAGRRPVSASSPDSVEVLPESSESHSVSVEILGSRSSSASLSSPLENPPAQFEKFSGASSIDLASPDSVEVVPEEDEDASFADDSYASASASESTMTQATVLEPHGHFSSAMDSSAHFLEPIDSLGPDIVTGPSSARTDSSLSSLVLDSSTDTIHSDSLMYGSHGSLGRSGMQLTLTSEYPQPTKSAWSVSNQSSASDRQSSAQRSSSETVLENSSSKLCSPKKTLSKSRESLRRSLEKKEIKGNETKSAESSSTLPQRETSPMDDGQFVVTLTDSSGEGTIMESSSDDTLPASDNQSQQSTSGYVKNMLADAMVDETPRGHSPNYAESRCDVIRLGSEQTSGHTSGDELETTTSSDIEIISSPNGDGSSTTSRQSPAKLLHRAPSGPADLLKFQGKMKGHQREPSEASSGGSDDSHCSEVDRLLKRLSEMSELLEARETKLLALSRSHAELQESYQELRSQLENAQQSRVSESRSLNDEFTRRLSALERKFQQAIRDRDALQRQLEQSRSELANQLSEHVGERDETIKELREEGEKLSRQQLQQSNLIKKLRAKEKESDNIIKSLREQVESLTGEVERLKRSLAAKEEVERSQIEAVHQLTARVKKQEAELTSMKDERDQAQRKAEQAQAALDSTNKELSAARAREEGADQRVREATQSVEESARAELEAALAAAQQHKRQVMAQLDKMREQLTQVETQHSRRESELLQRLESSERRSEELAQQLSEATRPLLRQLQTLQASNKTQQDSWERQERLLTDALSEAQQQLASVSDAERLSREELVSLRSKVSTMESKLSAATHAAQEAQESCLKLREELKQNKRVFEDRKFSLEKQLEESQREIHSLELQLNVERVAVEAEKRRSQMLQDQLRDRDRAQERDREREKEGGRRDSPPIVTSGQSSPTVSFGRESISESVSSMAWPVFSDDAFETSSISGRNVYESVRLGPTTSLLEALQSQLKLREGEVQQLQWELSRREAQRCALTTELSTLSARTEEQEKQIRQCTESMASMSAQLSALRTEYDALLQLYGEKLEESEELRLDLQDVKDMYKAQIDQLLKRDELSHSKQKKEESAQEPESA